MTATRDSLVTTKTDRRVAIWVSDGSGANAKEIVPATPSSGTLDEVTWAADRVLFTSTIGGHRSISSVGVDGGTAQEVVTQGGTCRPRPPTAGRSSSNRPTRRNQVSGRSLTVAAPFRSPSRTHRSQAEGDASSVGSVVGSVVGSAVGSAVGSSVGSVVAVASSVATVVSVGSGSSVDVGEASATGVAGGCGGQRIRRS